MTNLNSKQWFNKAKNFIPGGVNSPVRAFNDVGGTPVYFKKAVGSVITTEAVSYTHLRAHET